MRSIRRRQSTQHEPHCPGHDTPCHHLGGCFPCRRHNCSQVADTARAGLAMRIGLGHSGEHQRPRTRQAPMSATMQERGSSMSVPRIREQPIGCWLLVSAGEMANHYAYRRNRRNIVQITRSPDADRPPSVLGEEASPQRTLRPVDGSAAEGSVVMSHAKRIKDAADNARPGPGTGEQSRRRTLPRAAAFWIVAGLFLILFFASPAASLLYGGIPGPVHFPAAALAGRQFAVG
jgi:hypothetical protein